MNGEKVKQGSVYFGNNLVSNYLRHEFNLLLQTTQSQIR